MSKLQAVPLALAAGAVWLVAELRRRAPAGARHRVYLLAGAMLPTGLFLLPVLLAGQWDNFVISYFRANVTYAAEGGGLIAGLLEKSLVEDSLLHFWLPGTVLWCALAFRVRAVPERAARWFTGGALAATALAVVGVVAPARPFLHYWQLTVPPLTLLLGALLGNRATAPDGNRLAGRWLMAACALALLATLGVHRLRVPNFFMGAFTYFERFPREPVSTRLAAHARPGEAVVIWGWSNYIYVETALRQGNQEAGIARLVTPGPLQEYFRDRFLADVLVLRPEFFVDSVGRCSIYFQSPALKHDRVFPALAAVVRRDYVLIDEVDGAQIYRRRDLVTGVAALK